MAEQYQLPTGEFINEEEDGDEIQLPYVAYFLEDTVVAGGAENPWNYYAQQ